MLRVAKSMLEPIPSGKAWHKELLEQFARESPQIRPRSSADIPSLSWMNFDALDMWFTTSIPLSMIGNR